MSPDPDHYSRSSSGVQHLLPLFMINNVLRNGDRVSTVLLLDGHGSARTGHL
jgi:hypothetical protein